MPSCLPVSASVVQRPRLGVWVLLGALILGGALSPAQAQDDPASDPSMEEAAADSSETLRPQPQPLTVFGYYRLFTYARNMSDPYPGLDPFDKAYNVGDGYREPMLSLNILGRPNGRSSFGTELYVFTPYEGTFETNAPISLNLGLNFFGNFRTEVGSFGVRAGGIHWYNLSPFTIGVYQVLDRFTIFDRTPWEGVDGTDKYANYFTTGQTNPGDQRWNFQAFQGLVVNGFNLPGRTSFDLFYGKTQANGGLPGAITDPNETVDAGGGVPTYQGFAGEARVLPSLITGGKLQKSFDRGFVSYNTLYSYRTQDSLSGDRRGYQVHTASFEAEVAGIGFSGELGASRSDVPDQDAVWGEALMVRANIPADYTLLPLDVQLYQIGHNFFNVNGEIATNNNELFQPADEIIRGAGSAGGLLTQVNQLAHNRRGFNINTEINAGPVKLAAGWGIAQELEATTSVLSYIHRINGLAVSRIYNPFFGTSTTLEPFDPLGRQFAFFRGVFERVQTTDIDPITGEVPNRKYYHAVDLKAKYGTQLGNRDFFAFYLGSFASASDKTTVVPVYDDTYIFVQSHEFDVYYELLPGFILTGYAGIERAQGGEFTRKDVDSGDPRDQLATGLGLGFDWTVAPNAGLYFRHRWMDFEDRSFAIDQYRGREITLELKIFI
ncbi:MAG: hypothetical protein AAGI71_12625 [Bacteroidota bacterium]